MSLEPPCCPRLLLLTWTDVPLPPPLPFVAQKYAEDLESVRLRRFAGGIGAAKKEDVLQEVGVGCFLYDALIPSSSSLFFFLSF